MKKPKNKYRILTDFNILRQSNKSCDSTGIIDYLDNLKRYNSLKEFHGESFSPSNIVEETIHQPATM